MNLPDNKHTKLVPLDKGWQNSGVTYSTMMVKIWALPWNGDYQVTIYYLFPYSRGPRFLLLLLGCCKVYSTVAQQALVPVPLIMFSRSIYQLCIVELW